MQVSVSEFALFVLLASVLLGGLLWRFAWARRLAAIAAVSYFGVLVGGEAYGVAFLITAVGVWIVAAFARGLNPTTPPPRTRPSR